MKLWRYGKAIERLGERYTLMELLGSGGMADVCLAWDEKREESVAIKLMKPGEVGQHSLNSFLREAAHVAHWDHPNIVHIYGDTHMELLDLERGTLVPYIVMEYAQGGDLHTRLTPGQPYPLQDSLVIFHQLCLAVDYAHRQGVVHRDLKPLNILFRVLPDGSEQVVLSDFGLAVEVEATHHSLAGGGTLPYMAPEQFLGQIEPANDIFALGVILYQLCTGRLPFHRSMRDVRSFTAQRPVPARSLNPALPEALDQILSIALAEQPDARFASAREFWEQIVLTVDTDDPSTLQLPANHEQALWFDDDPPGDHVRIDGEARASGGHLVALAPPLVSQSTLRERTTDPYSAQTSVFDSKRTITRQKRRPLALLSLLFVLVLLGGLLVSSGLLTTLLAIVFGQPAPIATVILQPASKTETGTFSIPDTIDAPDSPQNSLLLRTILVTSQPVSSEVPGTGHGKTAATTASGIIHLVNGAYQAQTVFAGTIIPTKDGVQIQTDADVVVPANDTTTLKLGAADVVAHAVVPGTAGNIALDAIKNTCCGGTTIFARNLAAFTGGTDGKTYTYVSQQDKDQVVAALSQQQQTSVQGALKQQLHPNEQVTAAPTYTTMSPTDDPIGDTGIDKAVTTVHVSLTCQGMAYNQDALQTQGTRLLMAQAQHDPAIAGYQAVGVIHAQITQVERSAGVQNQVVVHVSAQGTWLAVISDAHKQQIARAIAGQSLAQAQTILSKAQGIQLVHILLQGTTLPTNPVAIHFQIATAP